MDSRPQWKPIGVYRITPLPILPIPPVPKKRVYKQFIPKMPLTPKKMRVKNHINYGELKNTVRKMVF